MFSDKLIQILSEYHLLKHPFYQSWNDGSLEISMLQHYAKQYFKNVDAFPRYLSGVHSQCTSKEARKILLENLIDEERGDEDHPELWLRFAQSLGVARGDVINSKPDDKTQKLVSGFLDLVKSSYASGLGALFAYEQQVPEIAASKIDGLKKFYNYQETNSGLKFFNVHVKADEWHAKECADLLNQLNHKEQEIALESAVKVAKLLWGFLDGIYYSKQ